jgi:hypothetical protein
VAGVAREDTKKKEEGVFSNPILPHLLIGRERARSIDTMVYGHGG